MNKLIFNLAICLASFCSAAAQAECPLFTTKIETGYRHDGFKWNIAGSNREPNVLSEMHWKNLKIWQIAARATMLTEHSIYVRGYADYGRILDGRARDSDYAGNGRTYEFSRSYSDAGHGEVFDLSLGAGYQFSFCDGRLLVSPLAGLSQEEQHLTMRHGFQSLNSFNPTATGPFHGLKSSYKARWRGPWIGTDVVYHVDYDLSFLGTLEYHWARYRGHGHWNLRPDLIHGFTQKTKGYGVVGSVGAVYNVCQDWTVGLTLAFQTWKGRPGKSRAKIALPEDGKIVIYQSQQRLNRVRWNSFNVMASVGYQF